MEAATDNHNYLIFIFYYHILIHFLIISRSIEFIFDLFEVFGSNRWGSLGKRFVNWGGYGPKQVNPLQTFKITHSYLIFIFYYCLLFHFLIISRSTEFIFDPFKVFLVKEVRLFGKKVSTMEAATDNHNYLIFIFYRHFVF